MTAIRLDGLGMTYPPGVVALAGVDLAVEPGEWLVLVGPSGCGKSTLLRLVAGLVVQNASSWQRFVCVAALVLAKRSLAGCDVDPRRCYNASHGLRAAE